MTHTHPITRIATVVSALAIFLLLGHSNLSTAAPFALSCEGRVLPTGCFFSQTTGGTGGYSVIDDSQAHFWAEYQRLGGAQIVGYPISRRFVYDGFVTQAFQKLVLQWRPEVGIAFPLNVFDELSEAGHDPLLYSVRQTPYPLVNFDPPGAPWEQIIANRQALLNANSEIRALYFSFSNPLNVFGLPTSRVEDMGNHYAIRTQRAVFQQWKVNVPWASAGQVTIANGGDIAKEVGWYHPTWLEPEPPSGTSTSVPAPVVQWIPRSVAVSLQQPGTLFVLQSRADDDLGRDRVMVSNDNGDNWDLFANSDMPNTCAEEVTMDFNTASELYALTCNGVFKWSGLRWELVATESFNGLAIEYGNSNVRWAIRDTPSSGLEFGRSEDGGSTWRELGQFLQFAHTLVVDSSTNQTLYAIDGYAVYGAKLVRMDAEQASTITPLPVGYSTDYPANPIALTINGANGDIYVATNPYRSFPTRLWRSQNADSANPNEITWDLMLDGYGQMQFLHLSAGKNSNGTFVLYGVLGPYPYDGHLPSVVASHDEGRTWNTINIPE